VTSAEELEIRRRSIAMLPPGAPAIAREDALMLLSELADLRRSLQAPVDAERQASSRRHPARGGG
jgi:hypothetical protein